MAPLPANNTRRLLVDYITGNGAQSQEHTLQVRLQADAEILLLQEEVAALLLSIGAGNFRQGWRVLRAREGPIGANFTVPIPIQTDLNAFIGTGSTALPPSDEAREWTFQGRSFTTGRRVDISLYGILGATPANFRFAVGAGAPAWVESAVNYLNTNAVQPNTAFRVIDGSRPTWYSYVNVNYNSYWERRIRSV